MSNRATIKQQSQNGVKSSERTFLNMADSIFHRQNDPFLLQCQIAQRQLYSSAKCVALWKSIFTMIFFVLSVVATILDIKLVIAISCLLAVALVLFNKYAGERIMAQKKCAASIQQYIDVTLFAPIIESSVMEWGEVPSKSDVACAISAYEDADTSEMKNWYSDYSSLSAESQIFYCQKENIRWDYDIHKKFKALQIIVMCSIGAILLTFFFIVNPSFIKLICILSWFAPIAEYGYSVYSEVQRSIMLLRDIDEYSNTIEQKLSSSNLRFVRQKLIKLQYKVLEKRINGFMIPNWFYKWHKDRQQSKEDSIARTIQKLNS